MRLIWALTCALAVAAARSDRYWRLVTVRLLCVLIVNLIRFFYLTFLLESVQFFLIISPSVTNKRKLWNIDVCFVLSILGVARVIDVLVDNSARAKRAKSRVVVVLASDSCTALVFWLNLAALPQGGNSTTCAGNSNSNEWMYKCIHNVAKLFTRI